MQSDFYGWVIVYWVAYFVRYKMDDLDMRGYVCTFNTIASNHEGSLSKVGVRIRHCQ